MSDHTPELEMAELAGPWRQRPLEDVPPVAQGVRPAAGRQEVVDWVVGRAEDGESWEALLTQMWERGITPKRGFRLLVGERAVAH